MLNARANSYIFSKKGPLRVIAFVTLWSFLFSIGGGEILVEKAWAARTPLELTGVGSNRAGSPSASIKDLNVETFTLPQYLGHIKDAFKGSSDKIVVHIQDAHCNYAAQHKISNIIEYLQKEYGINTINLEGGKGEYDLSIFTRIYDKDIREKVADYFVKEGLVNGAEYFAINNPEKAELWGVEDTELYLKNLNVYRESLKHKEDVERYLKELDHIVLNLKRHIYNPELLALDQKYTEYKTEKLEFKDYLTYLIQKAGQKAIDIKALANIYLLHQSLKQENEIDFKIANLERNSLIDEFEKMLSKNAIEELVQKTVEFKGEQISQKDYYAYLVKKANQMNFDLTKYPELQKYIVYISTYEAIDKVRIMEELAVLETKLKESIFENDDQKTLDTLSKNLILTKNIFGISISREDYEYYKKNEKSFDIQNHTTFIGKKAPIYKITAKLDSNINALDRYRKDISKFYNYSFKRDKVFLSNIKPANTTLLITGGFHTENLCELFKKKGISYISIMPNFKNGNGYESPYFNLLAGKECELQEKIYPIIASASSMQIASMLSNAIAPEVWGRANIDAFRAAVLVQEQIAKGRKITDITREGEDVIFHMDDGTTERLSVRTLLDAVHQRDIDAQMEKLSEEDFEDIENVNEILDELIDFLRSAGASQEVLDRVEALKGTNVDGRALIRLVRGVTFRGHAGGQGIRLNGVLKVDRKEFRTMLGLPAEPKSDSIPSWVRGNFGNMSDEEIEIEIRKAVAAGNYDLADMLAEFLLERQENRLKGVLLHEIIAGLFGDHFLAERVEQAFLADQTDGTMLAGIQALGTGIWDMTPEERLGVDRDFAKEEDKLSLLDRLNQMFARPEEQKAESARRVAALEIVGQSPVEYYGNRKAYLKALLDMKIKDNILNKGVRDIRIETKGSDIIQYLMVADANGNRFIVIVKNNVVQEVAMPVRRVGIDKISPEAPRADKYEFVVVDDQYAREIFQAKLAQHRAMNLGADGKFIRKKFPTEDAAKVMCGFLTEDEIEDAKKAIQEDFLLAHLFGLIDSDFSDVNLRGFIAIEVPKDHGGYYDGERVYRILGEGFDRGLYAHELIHHVYRKLKSAARRIQIGMAQPGDERLGRLFEKIQTHLQEDKHRKLFDWLRRDKLYADRVAKNPVYLRDEALAYLVDAIFERKTIEPHSGYQITFRDIQLLVELGILPRETYGNSELFEGVDLDAPLPATFHQVVELYRRMESVSQVLSDAGVLQAIKGNAKDGVGNLMNLINWMIAKGHFKEVEALLINLGQDTELEYDGKWEELLFSFFILYHNWAEADPRNAENIFNLLSIQLQIDVSTEVFLKIFASKGLSPERLRQFFTAHADNAQLKGMFSNLLIKLFSKLDKTDQWDYRGRYVLYRAIGMIYYILGMEEVAQEFLENADELELMLDIVDKSNILSLMESPEESLSPEEKERKLKEAIEGQGFDLSIFAKAISEFNFNKFNPTTTLGPRLIENKDRALTRQEIMPLFTPSMAEGFSFTDDNIEIDPQLFEDKIVDFKIQDIGQQLNLQIQPINARIQPLAMEFHNIEINIVEHKTRGRVAAVVGFLRMLKNIAKILLNPKVDRSVKTLLLRLTWETFKSNFIRGFFDDINIADVGLDAPEHREVNNVIKQAALEGRLEDRGEVNGKRVIVVKGVDVLVAGQRAHAGIEQNVIYVAESAYNETLVRHEAIELQKWQEKALELAGMDKNTNWTSLSVEQRRALKQGLRQWIRGNIEEARRLEIEYHNEANKYAKITEAEIITDNTTEKIAPTEEKEKVETFWANNPNDDTLKPLLIDMVTRDGVRTLDIFMGGFVLVQPLQVPNFRLVTRGLAECTGIAVRIRDSNGQYCYGLGHRYIAGRASLQDDMKIIHDQLLAKNFAPENIEYFVNYNPKWYSEHNEAKIAKTLGGAKITFHNRKEKDVDDMIVDTSGVTIRTILDEKSVRELSLAEQFEDNIGLWSELYFKWQFITPASKTENIGDGTKPQAGEGGLAPMGDRDFVQELNPLEEMKRLRNLLRGDAYTVQPESRFRPTKVSLTQNSPDSINFNFTGGEDFSDITYILKAKQIYDVIRYESKASTYIYLLREYPDKGVLQELLKRFGKEFAIVLLNNGQALIYFGELDAVGNYFGDWITSPQLGIVTTHIHSHPTKENPKIMNLEGEEYDITPDTHALLSLRPSWGDMPAALSGGSVVVTQMGLVVYRVHRNLPTNDRRQLVGMPIFHDDDPYLEDQNIYNILQSRIDQFLTKKLLSNQPIDLGQEIKEIHARFGIYLEILEWDEIESGDISRVVTAMQERLKRKEVEDDFERILDNFQNFKAPTPDMEVYEKVIGELDRLNEEEEQIEDRVIAKVAELNFSSPVEAMEKSAELFMSMMEEMHVQMEPLRQRRRHMACFIDGTTENESDNLHISEWINTIVRPINEMLLAQRAISANKKRMESRQARTSEALATKNMPGDIVRAFVVRERPKDATSYEVTQSYNETGRRINRGLSRNGYNLANNRDNFGDQRQLVVIEVDSIKDRRAVEEAIKKAINETVEEDQRTLSAEKSRRAHYVVYAPEIEDVIGVSANVSAEYEKTNQITVIPDSYEDQNIEENKHPDYMFRIALARKISYFYNSTDKDSTFESIKTLLSQIIMNSQDIDDIVKRDGLRLIFRLLRIRPIVFESLKQWQVAQEAVATAL